MPDDEALSLSYEDLLSQETLRHGRLHDLADVAFEDSLDAASAFIRYHRARHSFGESIIERGHRPFAAPEVPSGSFMPTDAILGAAAGPLAAPEVPSESFMPTDAILGAAAAPEVPSESFM